MGKGLNKSERIISVILSKTLLNQNRALDTRPKCNTLGLRRQEPDKAAFLKKGLKNDGSEREKLISRLLSSKAVQRDQKNRETGQAKHQDIVH